LGLEDLLDLVHDAEIHVLGLLEAEPAGDEAVGDLVLQGLLEFGGGVELRDHLARFARSPLRDPEQAVEPQRDCCVGEARNRLHVEQVGQVAR